MVKGNEPGLMATNLRRLCPTPQPHLTARSKPAESSTFTGQNYLVLLFVHPWFSDVPPFSRRILFSCSSIFPVIANGESHGHGDCRYAMLQKVDFTLTH